MKVQLQRISTLGSFLFLACAARAVYAPIPEQEQGTPFVVSVAAGVNYDSNIFGSASDPIHSVVWELIPDLKFNDSLTQQTFLSAEYQPTLDYFENRPGSKLLDSQMVSARLAHSFSKVTTADLSDTFDLDHNPASTLNGVPLNSDQSLITNETDARVTTALTEETDLTVKARESIFDYLDPVLGDELNRSEDLVGLEGTDAILPDVKLAGEFRHQDEFYKTDADLDDKHSEFLMAGADYSPDPKLSGSFRVGAEYRVREGAQNETAPYGEFTARYAYATGCYISTGYVYSLTETSDPIDYTDERSSQLFVNVQQTLTARIIGSASLSYDPAQLLGRAGVADIHEDTTHAGAALSYEPSKAWVLSATYDYDIVDSDIYSRGLERSRAGLRAAYTF